MLTIAKMTAQQRDFALAILERDAVPHYGDIRGITAVLAACQTAQDHFVRIPLTVRDRRALVRRMTFHHLQLVGVRGFKLGRTPAIPEPALFPEYEMGPNMELPLQDPPYLLCRLQERPIDGMILESHRTELTPRTIRHLFEPAVPCWARLEAALVRSAIPELMKPRRNAGLYLAMLHGSYTDAERSMQNAGQLELIEHAFDILAAAGLCQVREIVGESDPPGVRRMKVEWTELAYVEGTAVRQKTLTEEEEVALGSLIA
jgi:hypothetical protein